MGSEPLPLHCTALQCAQSPSYLHCAALELRKPESLPDWFLSTTAQYFSFYFSWGLMIFLSSILLQYNNVCLLFVANCIRVHHNDSASVLIQSSFATLMHDSSPSIHFRPQWTSYNIEMESYWCGVHSMPVFFDFIILLKGTLCLSLIRPHLKFACSVWNLHTMNDNALPEDVHNLHAQYGTFTQ